MILLTELQKLGEVYAEIWSEKFQGFYLYVGSKDIDQVVKLLKQKKIKPIFHAVSEKSKSRTDYENGISEQYKMYFSLKDVEIDLMEPAHLDSNFQGTVYLPQL